MVDFASYEVDLAGLEVWPRNLVLAGLGVQPIWLRLQRGLGLASFRVVLSRSGA